MVTGTLVVCGLVVAENLDGGESLDSVLGAEGLILGTVDINKLDIVSLERGGGLFEFRLESCLSKVRIVFHFNFDANALFTKSHVHFLSQNYL